MAIKMRYGDCPYNCNANGELLDANMGRFIPCPYCSEKRKSLVRDGKAETDDTEDGVTVDLSSALGIETKYLTGKLVYANVVPEGEKLFIEDDSIDYQQKELEGIYLGISAGELPSKSYCFGISIKGQPDMVAYPLLSKAIQAGFKVVPFMSCTEYNHSIMSNKVDVLDYYKADIVVMLINEGATREDLAIAKGLMQSRGIKGKPTIFITTWSVEACSQLLGYYGNDSYSLATPVFLEYHTSKRRGHTKYINQLLGVENGVDMGDYENTQQTSVVQHSTNNYSMSFNDLK